MQAWQKDMQRTVQQWSQQKALRAKYMQLEEKGQFHSQLHSELNKKLQFPKQYADVATALDGDDSMGDSWKLEDAWKALRRKHVQECQKLIFGHQEKAFNMFSHQVTFGFPSHAKVVRCYKNQFETF